MKLALKQFEPVAGDVSANLDRIAKVAAASKAMGADLLVTPELCLTGYGMGAEFLRLAEPADGAMLASLRRIAEGEGLAIVAGFPERAGDTLYNSAVFMAPGERSRIYRKRHLYGEMENSVFLPSDAPPDIFSFAGFKIGMLICFDIEFPETVRGLALSGAELVITPTALPSTSESHTVSRRMVPTRAQENHVFIAYADLCGSDERFVYHGGSAIIGPDGEDLARAGSRETLLVTTLDHTALERSRRENPYLEVRRPELYRSLGRFVNGDNG